MRPPAPDDAEAVLAVLVARDLADHGSPDWMLSDVRDEWGSSEVDLAADAVVAETGAGQLAGYAVVRRFGAMAVVAPDREAGEIGRRLVGWAERRERDLGRRRHRQWVSGGNDRARAILVDAGYTLVRSHSRMVRALTGLPEASPPPGTRLRALDGERDAATIHALDDASFSATPEYEPETLAQFREEHLQASDHDPALSVVAEQDGLIAGFLLARRRHERSVGYVDILAVHPDRQRQGLGAAMLRTAFHGFAAAGLHEAQLGVASDNPTALRLYRREGMTPRFTFEVHERPVDAARGR